MGVPFVRSRAIANMRIERESSDNDSRFSSIDEAQRFADELEVSEVQYRSLFVDNPQAMYVYDPQTLRFLAVNAAGLGQYGYTEEEFGRMTTEELRPPEDRAAWREMLFSRPLQGQRRHTGRHLRKDGQLLWVQIVANDILFEGRPARVVIAFDITEQRRAQE